jgi:dienelactone hydrolase
MFMLGCFCHRCITSQTATLALRAPFPLPFELGYAWHAAFDDGGEPIVPASGERRRSDSLQRSVHLLQQLIVVLRDQCGWPADRIFLLGYGQGGTCALSLALSLARNGSSSASAGNSSSSSSSSSGTRLSAGAVILGGVIAICGALLDEEEAQFAKELNKRPHVAQHSNQSDSSSGSCRGATPVLLLCGERDAEVSPARMQRTAAVCARVLNSSLLSSSNAAGAANSTAAAAANTAAATATAAAGVEVVVLPNRGQGMLKGAREVRPLMAFLARHLARRLVALEEAADVVELSTSASTAVGGATVTQV